MCFAIARSRHTVAPGMLVNTDIVFPTEQLRAHKLHRICRDLSFLGEQAATLALELPGFSLF